VSTVFYFPYFLLAYYCFSDTFSTCLASLFYRVSRAEPSGITDTGLMQLRCLFCFLFNNVRALKATHTWQYAIKSRKYVQSYQPADRCWQHTW